MIEISHKTAATVTLDTTSRLAFNDLPALVSWLLKQADVTVHNLDIGLMGDSIEYMTDHGSLTLTMRDCPAGGSQIEILCNTLVRGSREVGRQLAYQVVRRLIARADVASVMWHPTRQRIFPESFTWGRLADAPQRLAS